MANAFRTVGALVAAAALLAVPALSAAQQARSTIVAQPAVVPVAFTTSQAPASAVRAGAPVRAVPTSIIIVAPQPFPPLPPNFCNRGNSSGVSRC